MNGSNENARFPGLTAVIVNWNLKRDTIDCVRSLLEAGAHASQVIVVDNGSSDGSPQALRDGFGDELIQVQAGSNLGFAGGTNLGVERALQAGAAWILLLNNDTVVSQAFLSHLHQAVQEAAQRYAVFAPLIYYFDRPDQIWYLGDRLVPGTLITTNPFRGRTLSEAPLPASGIFEVDFVSGSGMLVRRDVFEQVGLLDTSLYMYAEEVDFCLRARKAGFRFAAVPQAEMWHKVSLSARRVPPQTRYLRTRNQIWIYRRYSRGLLMIVMFLFTAVRSLAIAIGDLFRGQTGLLPALMRGWWHGWTRAPGANQAARLS